MSNSQDRIEPFISSFAAELQRRGADVDQITTAVEALERTLKEAPGNVEASSGSPAAYAEQVLSADTSNQAATWDERTFRATAFDEMEVLHDAGELGWELIDVGALALHCRRPRRIEDASQWEYRRRITTDAASTLRTMSELGWSPCGTWGPMHYFKRRLNEPVRVADHSTSR